MKTITVQELVEEYPVLLTLSFQHHKAGMPEDLNATLASCGYRFEEIEDVIKAQKGEFKELKDFFARRLVKIGQCL